MPRWQADNSGGLRLEWASPDDLLTFIRSVIEPALLTYGYRIVVEPVPKEESGADRV